MKSPFITHGVVRLPRTKLTQEVLLPLPKEYHGKNIVSIHVRPLYHASVWELLILYEVREIDHSLDRSRALGIDLGMANYATCVDSVSGDSFIVDGKRLKSILQGYCKYSAKLCSINAGNTNTKRQNSLRRKTHTRVRDSVCNSVDHIVS